MQTPEKYRSLFPNPLPNNPEYLSIVHPNQINNAWLGVCGYQPFAQHISSSRAQMLSQHIGQALVMMEPDERMIQTTADKEYAKYTFAVAMPQNGRILHYIQKYPPGLGADTIKANPKTTVIYESEDGQIDYFDLEDYHTEHQYFGFRYEASEKLSQLRPGQDFKKGEVFLKSPLVSERGGWKLGATANVAMFSHPGTAEDSVLVRRGFLKRMRFKTYRTRVFEYGRNEFPRNLYGDEKKFKIMPDIGELIAPHGYLCAMGKYDDANLAFVEQSAKSMREIDEFDNTVHVGPGGRVVDIQVIHDMKDDKYIQPDMDAQVLKYYQAGKKYYQEIYDVYRRLLAQRGAGLNISGRFHHLVVEAQTVITPTKARTIHRRTPIDRFRVVVTVEYEIEPNIGFKVTGLSGDKAIMCKIVEDCDMPVDAHGTVADFVTSEDSTVGRNNVSRLYEQYVSSAQVQLHREICHALGAMPKMAFARAIKHLNAVPESVVKACWQRLLRFYEITRMETAEVALAVQDPRNWLATIVSYGVNLIWPTDNNVYNPVMALEIEREFRPLRAPIKYVCQGKVITTRTAIRIGPMYMMLLEKTGDDWSACSSTKTHFHGVPAQTSMADKYRTPARETGVRFTGEAEVRILVSYIGPEPTMELLDRNANPIIHGVVNTGILEAERCGDIGLLVDRHKYPYGGSKPLQMVHHLNTCAGWAFDYKKAAPTC